MKILTVTVPCYNSEAYMEKCIRSLLPGGEDIEILIVDDGSTKDRTAQIADAYAAKYPGIVRAIHQENGGHGEAVNTGIKNASGLYFKVVDSDDWVGKKALLEIIARLKQLEREKTPVDVFLTNFVYNKEGARHKKVMRFGRVFPEEQIFTWSDVRHMKATQYVLMHNLIYRTGLLRRCGLKLPAHTFYVDNIFAFQPYPYAKKLYYMDVDFYFYYVGRSDQSVNEEVMIRRIDQQIRVNEMMVDIMASQNFFGLDKNVKKYMYKYLNTVTTATNALLLVSGTEENLEKKREFWRYIRRRSFPVYWHLRTSGMGIGLNLPGEFGRKIDVRGYKIARKMIGFN